MSNRTTCTTDAYVRNLTAYQPHLHGYIFASLANYTDAEDVLQRTNLTLLKKESSFPDGGEFLPWAIAVAKYEILAYIRDTRRDRVVFNPHIVEMMSESAAEEALTVSDRQEALRACLNKLPQRSRHLLSLRYAGENSLQHIAGTTGRSIDGVKAMLFRLRRKLEQCVEQRMMQK